MEKITPILNFLNKKPVRASAFILLVILSYTFNVWVRVHYANYDDRFVHDGTRIITCLDGYYFGTVAKKNLQGKDAGEFFPRRATDDFSYFTALISKVTSFSISELMAYLPIVISSLMVLPILLIGRLFNHTLLGFCSAMVVPICPLLYQRTLLGWYDTDMIAFTLPMFVLYFLVRYLTNKNLLNILWASIAVISSIGLYPSNSSLCMALVILTVLVLLVLVSFSKEKEWTYREIYPAITLLMLCISNSDYTNLPMLLCIIVVFYALFHFREIPEKALKILCIASSVFFMVFAPAPRDALDKILGYTDRGSSGFSTGEKSLKFLNVNTTIIETAKVQYEEFLNEAVGNALVGNLGLIGILLFIFNYRKSIIFLPLLGLGVFSMYGGVRFAPYASFTLVFGFVYLTYMAVHLIQKRIVGSGNLLAGLAKYGIVLIVVYLFPFSKAMDSVERYKNLTPAFNKYEVEALEKLKEISSSEDYAIAWWDYGYFIPFYADVRTIINGGKHYNDNFIVSKILQTPSQRLAANFSRLAAEVYARKPTTIIDQILITNSQKIRDPNNLLEKMKSPNFRLPKKTREVYIYLPHHLLPIFNNVKKFGEVDLLTGQSISSKSLSVFRANSQGEILRLSDNMYINQNDISTLYVNKKPTKLNTFTIIGHENGEYKKTEHSFDGNSNRHVIFVQRTGEFILMDNDMYQTLFVQLFFFKNYDKELFDLVVDTELVRIYKIKV